MTRQRIYMDPRTDCAELRAITRQFHPDAQIMGKCPPPAKPATAARAATELTPAGEQLVIPGCERNAVAGPRKPRQSTLWD